MLKQNNYRVLLKGAIFIALILFATTSLVFAKDIEIVAAVDKSELALEDTLSLTVTIIGAADAPMPLLPDFDLFSLIFGPTVSVKTSVINGVESASQSFTYALKPTCVGSFFIGSFTVRYKGRTYKSNTLRVDVFDAEKRMSPEKKRQKEIDLNKLIFVEISADKEDAYIFEQVALTCKLFSRKGLPIKDIKYVEPPIKGFVRESLGRQKQYQSMVDGSLFNVVELKSFVFPVASGNVEIEPAMVDCILMVKPRLKGGHGFFNDPFINPILEGLAKSYGEIVPISRKSNSVILNVKPCPEAGKPPDFSGAVGSFSLEVDIKPAAVKVGDPITVTMKVSGFGNMRFVDEPSMHFLSDDDFTEYSSDVSASVTKYSDGIKGSKIFKKVFEPKNHNIKEFPGISFSFFNPASKKYETITREPMPLSVQAPEFEKPVHVFVHKNGGNEHARIISSDILPIMTSLAHFKSRSVVFRSYAAVAAFLIAPTLMVVFAFLFQKHKRRLEVDYSYKMHLNTQAGIKAMFKDAEDAVNGSAPEQFYSTLFRILAQYLAHKLNTNPANIDSKSAPEMLRRKGIPAETVNNLIAVMEACDYGRFTGSPITMNKLKDDLNNAEEFVSLMEKH